MYSNWFVIVHYLFMSLIKNLNCSSVLIPSIFLNIFEETNTDSYSIAYSLPFTNSNFKFKLTTPRSSRPEGFCKKAILRNLTKFTGKHLCQSLFFNKVAGLRPATLLKKRLWHRCFPVNFVKFLRAPFYTEHLRWLLLYSIKTEYSYSVDFFSRLQKD